MPWLLDEDRALKEKLSGVQIYNYADGKLVTVQVYYRFPDTEERVRTYPHLALDLIDIRYDHERAQRALSPILLFDLEQATPPSGFSMVADDAPIPWTLVYQLGAYSRNPNHDRQLMLWLYQAFPQQFGSLNMASYDGTVRRADLESVVRRDMIDGDKKRVYRVIFTVGISSEFYLNQIQYIQNATSFHVTVTGYPNSLSGAGQLSP